MIQIFMLHVHCELAVLFAKIYDISNFSTFEENNQKPHFKFEFERQRN